MSALRALEAALALNASLGCLFFTLHVDAKSPSTLAWAFALVASVSLFLALWDGP